MLKLHFKSGECLEIWHGDHKLVIAIDHVRTRGGDRVSMVFDGPMDFQIDRMNRKNSELEKQVWHKRTSKYQFKADGKTLEQED